MATKVHKRRFRKFGTTEINGTLCNRRSFNGEDINSTDVDAKVTCVLCRKLLTLIKKTAA